MMHQRESSVLCFATSSRVNASLAEGIVCVSEKEGSASWRIGDDVEHGVAASKCSRRRKNVAAGTIVERKERRKGSKGS